MMPVLGAAVLSAALAVGWLLLAPRTPDLAAQVFRTELWRDEGFVVFSLQWYGGHHVAGYSLLFPPLGAAVGPRVVGAIAAVVSAVLFAALAQRYAGDKARVAIGLFAVGMLAELVIGRLTFVLGTALALGALLALQRDRHLVAFVLAIATTAASPVAGLFLALAALAARAVHVAAAAFGAAVALALVFPSGGSQSWGVTSALLTLGCVAVVAPFLPKGVLRNGAILYAAAIVAAFLIATPMGSNATRLAALVAAPLLVLVARTRWALLALVPLLVFQWYGPVRELRKHNDSATAAYHRPLVEELERRKAERVEVPFTRLHWESVHVAREVPLARGWEAQVDRDRNPLFYDGDLTAERYARWLRENAVGYVALPDVPLDPAARAEGRLIAAGLPFLKEVWKDEHWRLFEVRRKRRTGAASQTPTSFTVDATKARPRTVRMRWTRYWEVSRGRACVRRSPDGWTTVEAERAGRIQISARLRLDRLIVRGRSCGAG